MKKILALLLSLALIFTFCACGDKEEAEEPSETQETQEEVQEETAEAETAAEETAEPEEKAETTEVKKENMVDPSEVPVRGDEPPKGDDRSSRGIPELKDVLTYDDGDLLVLVNKYHGVTSDYRPNNLVPVDPALATWSDVSLKQEAYDAYLKMYEDAKKQGFNLKICSGFRTYDGQQQLFYNALGVGEEYAHMSSAYPGRSEHHTGLAIDITSASMGWGLTQDFADYPDGKWLDEHCQEYGFILRYLKGAEDITGYKYEPWHFRYVGVEVATEIMEKGITLEEYLGEA